MENKTSSIFIRVDPTTKNQAENILKELGIPLSVAVNLFLKQIIIQGGIPFKIKGDQRPLSLRNMSKEEFDAWLLESVKEIQEGKVMPAEEVYSEIKKKYGF